MLTRAVVARVLLVALQCHLREFENAFVPGRTFKGHYGSVGVRVIQ